jgi:hypothetical protein
MKCIELVRLVVYFMALYVNSLGGNEGHYRICVKIVKEFWPRFKPGTSQIQIRSIIA